MTKQPVLYPASHVLRKDDTILLTTPQLTHISCCPWSELHWSRSSETLNTSWEFLTPIPGTQVPLILFPPIGGWLIFKLKWGYERWVRERVFLPHFSPGTGLVSRCEEKVVLSSEGGCSCKSIDQQTVLSGALSSLLSPQCYVESTQGTRRKEPYNYQLSYPKYNVSFLMGKLFCGRSRRR